MHLLPEPLFTLPTDSTYMMCVAGTASGRIFLGGKDGCLYEFAYRADDGWFGKKVRLLLALCQAFRTYKLLLCLKAQKINHSTSSLSFLVPSFINAALYEEDAIVQIEVDNSRNVIYTRYTSTAGLIITAISELFCTHNDSFQIGEGRRLRL